MIYLVPTAGKLMLDMPSDKIGIIRTCYTGGGTWGLKKGYKWAADNAAFTRAFDTKRFFEWLESMMEWKHNCLFVAVPDVVGNALATLDSYRYWAWRIKTLGYKVAFVAQDGQESYPLPPEYDVLFVGGTTAWKMGNGAVNCIRRAQKAGKKVHVGRVNSGKRCDYFRLLDIDSVDGTNFVFAPNKNKKNIIRWMNKPALFTMED